MVSITISAIISIPSSSHHDNIMTNLKLFFVHIIYLNTKSIILLRLFIIYIVYRMIFHVPDIDVVPNLPLLKNTVFFF